MLQWNFFLNVRPSFSVGDPWEPGCDLPSDFVGVVFLKVVAAGTEGDCGAVFPLLLQPGSSGG